MYTPFAYEITKTPYAFFAKIILCMYLLYAQNQSTDCPTCLTFYNALVTEIHMIAFKGKQ